MLQGHHGSMPPKGGRGASTPSSQPKGKGKNAGQEDHMDIIQFGLPQPVSSALQAISARSTAGLFKDAVALPSDQTAQQVAQSRANSLDRINKRLNGNMKAKAALRDAAQAWLGKFGQHLMALTDRLHNIANKLDQDQTEAIGALQTATMSLEVDPQDQVQAALASLGPIWTPGQENEVLRLATQLRAFSTVPPETLPPAMLPVASSKPMFGLPSGPSPGDPRPRILRARQSHQKSKDSGQRLKKIRTLIFIMFLTLLQEHR